jgi:hypothetical protein
MSDLPQNGWRLPPQDYLARRPATYSSSREPVSCYVTLRDGVRLAVDIYLPSDSDGTALAKPLPTIVIFTPYYRRFALRSGAPPVSEPSISAGRYRDFFVPRGYALVVVDVRGTGASFGVREGFRSPKERDDYREIVDWIVAQRWSNGAVAATGISYVGAAADFLASTGHPAVKAIAPLFSVWDTYSDHYYPGGMLLNRLAETYDELMIGLDHAQGELLSKFAYYKDPQLSGPAPVDEDHDGALLKSAISEHLGNFHMPDFIREFAFKEEGLPYDPSFSSASFSPYAYCHGVRPDVAVYSVSGWMDGDGHVASPEQQRTQALDAGNRQRLRDEVAGHRSLLRQLDTYRHVFGHRLQLRTRRKRAIDDRHRFAQLVTLQRQSRRPHAIASHADTLLHQLDELHELDHRVHAQQRQEPLVERERLGLSSLARIPVKRHRFGGKRVDKSCDPSDRARIDRFNDGVVDTDQNLHARVRQRADRHHAPNVGARFLDGMQIGKLLGEFENVLW